MDLVNKTLTGLVLGQSCESPSVSKPVSDSHLLDDDEFIRITRPLFIGMDNVTFRHSFGVGGLSSKLAKLAAKYNPKVFMDGEIDFVSSIPEYRLEFVYALHDIGKVDPRVRRVLEKQGKLTPEEWEVIRFHSEIGAEKIRSIASVMPKEYIDDVKWAMRVANGHHQTFNNLGNTYPKRRLSDRNSAIVGIGKIVDIIDALASPRYYKNAMSIDDVKKEIVWKNGDFTTGSGELHPAVTNFILDSWDTVEKHMELRQKDWLGPKMFISETDEEKAKSIYDKMIAAKTKEEKIAVVDAMVALWRAGIRTHMLNFRDLVA